MLATHKVEFTKYYMLKKKIFIVTDNFMFDISIQLSW